MENFLSLRRQVALGLVLTVVFRTEYFARIIMDSGIEAGTRT
jgi:hypothetical protein